MVHSGIKYFIVMVVVLLSTGLSAQSIEQNYQHHDVMISYGAFPFDQFLSVESAMLNHLYPDKRYVRDHYSGSGIVSLSYRKITGSEKYLWGISAGYNQSKCSIYYLADEVGQLSRQFIAVAVDFEYRYVNRGILQIYSGGMLGYQFGTEKLTPPANSEMADETGSLNRIAYQANVMGIRVGKDIAGFMEFGFGYKGMVNLGISAQLY